MDLDTTERVLDDRQFDRLRSMAHSLWGLQIEDQKRVLVDNRIRSLLRRDRIQGVESFLDSVEKAKNKKDGLLMFDALSTNLTSFFRDPIHFTILTEQVLHPFQQEPGHRKLRIWSAGCSEGAEPYSIAMQCMDSLQPENLAQVEIQATDYATSVLEKASRGVYADKMIRGLDPALVQRYFLKGKGDREGMVRVVRNLRKAVRFGLLNLVEAWRQPYEFDAIFCRNVMIYFDRPTRNTLVERFLAQLVPGGLLFFGSSENLSPEIRGMKSIGTSVYKKS